MVSPNIIGAGLLLKITKNGLMSVRILQCLKVCALLFKRVRSR